MVAEEERKKETFVKGQIVSSLHLPLTNSTNKIMQGPQVKDQINTKRYKSIVLLPNCLIVQF